MNGTSGDQAVKNKKSSEQPPVPESKKKKGKSRAEREREELESMIESDVEKAAERARRALTAGALFPLADLGDSGGSPDTKLESELSKHQKRVYETGYKLGNELLNLENGEKTSKEKTRKSGEIEFSKLETEFSDQKLNSVSGVKKLEFEFSQFGQETERDVSSTFIHSPLEEKEEQLDVEKRRIVLDEIALRAALNEMRNKGATKGAERLIEALYRRAEKEGSISFSVSMADFAAMSGMSRSTLWTAWKHAKESGLIENHTAIKSRGTYVELRSSFFFAPDRKIDKYRSIYLSGGDSFTTLILLTARTVIPSSETSPKTDEVFLGFAERVRRSLTCPAKREAAETAAILLALLESFSGPKVDKPAAYARKVLSDTPVQELSARISEGKMKDTLKKIEKLEKCLTGDIDELSGMDFSEIFGQKIKRTEGVERIYALCTDIQNSVARLRRSRPLR